MKRRYWLFILGLAGAGQQVKAQTSQTLDSLLTYLRTHPAGDSAYVQTMDRAAYELIYKKADYARADSLARQMADLATRTGNWTKVAGAYRNRGMIYLLRADYEQAMTYFQKTLEVAEKHNLPPQTIYGAMSNVIVGHDKLRHDEQVIELATRAIRYQEQHRLKTRSPLPHRLIGEALVRMGRQQQAIPYYQQAGVLFRELGDPRGIAIFENQLGDFYLELKQPRVALNHFRQALQLADNIQFELLQADAMDGLGNALRVLNRPADALPYLERGLRIAEKQKHLLGVTTFYGSMGLTYQAQKDYPQAETYLRKAIALSEKNGYKDELKKHTQALADLYAEQNKFQQAYVVQLQKNKLIDSTTALRTNAEVQRLLARYEADSRNAQIRLLRNQQQLQQQQTERTRWQRNALLAGAVLLLLLGGATTAWLLNRARLRRLQEAQQLRKQIAHDLHDEVGSTLSSISLLSGMVNDLIAQKRPESAERAIQKINTDARQILETIDEIIWTINPGNDSWQRVMLRLKEYAQPLMESKHIAFSLTDDPGLDEVPISMEVRRNLYLVAKEAINNLVKYSEATQATMRFTHQHNQIRVVIEDNGRGFDVTQASGRTGQQSMRARASAMGGSLTVQSEVGSGTKLELVVGS